MISPVRVIVNSDDLGMNPVINATILDLIDRRRVTSSTLLANGPSVEEAVRFLPKRVSYSLGVHLNLSEFEPLTPSRERWRLAGCLKGDGAFAGEQALADLVITDTLREAIFQELRLQVEKVIALGVKVSHFDSHNHVHTLPWMFPVLKRLQKHFAVRKVRTTWNIYRASNPSSPQLRLKKWAWDFALRHYYKTTTTDGLTTLSIFCEIGKRTELSGSTIELMTHPGHPAYESETQLLYRPWEQEMPFPVELIDYHALK